MVSPPRAAHGLPTYCPRIAHNGARTAIVALMPRSLRSPLLLVLLAACAGAVVLLALRPAAPGGVELVIAEPPAGIDEIRVDVGGAVHTPGVVRALPGERIADVIERAGGFTPDADPAALNLARRVVDQDVVRVPLLGAAAVAALIDLNHATTAELESLPGIGPVYAGRLVEAREQSPLRSTDEVVERGIWPQHTYSAIRDLITTQ